MTYEKRFLDVRDKLVMRRAELKMKHQQRNLNSAFSNDLCQASSAAESILAQFDDHPGPSFPSSSSRPNFPNNNTQLQTYPNYGMLSRNNDRGRPLPPVMPMLNYTHRKGMNNMNLNMIKMLRQQQRPGIAGPSKQINKPNIQMQNNLQQNNGILLSSIRIDDKQYEEAKNVTCPTKLSNSNTKRFKFLRSKNENQLNEEEKIFIERYTFIVRKRNQYLFEERERKRQELESVGEQPAPPGASSNDFTSDAMEEI